MKNIGQLEQLINSFGKGSQSQFAHAVGIKQSTIATWLARQNFDPDRIKRAFPQVDGNWLLTGEGNMLLPGKVGDVHVNGGHNTTQVNSSGDIKAHNSNDSESQTNSKEQEMLQKEITYLKKLLAEKERLISVLLGDKR